MYHPSGTRIVGTHPVYGVLLRVLRGTVGVVDTAAVRSVRVKYDTAAKLVVVIAGEYQIVGGFVCKVVAAVTLVHIAIRLGRYEWTQELQLKILYCQASVAMQVWVCCIVEAIDGKLYYAAHVSRYRNTIALVIWEIAG